MKMDHRHEMESTVVYNRHLMRQLDAIHRAPGFKELIAVLPFTPDTTTRSVRSWKVIWIQLKPNVQVPPQKKRQNRHTSKLGGRGKRA